MISTERWQDNWRFATSGGAIHVKLTRTRGRRHWILGAVRELAVGTPIVLSASAPGAARRCRAFASAAGIECEREYLTFPTAAAPAYLVQDAPAPVRLFVASMLAAPPRARFSLPLEIGFGLLRRFKSWRVVRALAPGRIVVGRVR